MRYLKKYNIFKEENEFDVNVNDAPDIKMSKEKLTTLTDQISVFKQKKNQIDKIYVETEDDYELKKKIETLLGPEIGKFEDRNPFMVEYLNISDLKRRLQKVNKDNVDDKLKLDDLNQELKSATDDAQKTSIKTKISDINKRMSLSNSTISKLDQEILNSEKAMKNKMVKQEKDMKTYIKDLNDKKSK
jgi:hypothetical protein